MRRTEDEPHLKEVIKKLPLTIVFGAEAGGAKMIGYHVYLSYECQSKLHAVCLQYFLASCMQNTGESSGKQGEKENEKQEVCPE